MISSVPDGPLILFRHAAPGDFYGRLGIVRLPLPAAGEAPRMIAPISCDWVHYASGRGVCMVARESGLPVRLTHTSSTSHSARSIGSARQDRLSVTRCPGRPPRSAHGFEQGHSYADQMFSTRTIVIDTATGKTVADRGICPSHETAGFSGRLTLTSGESPLKAMATDSMRR